MAKWIRIHPLQKDDGGAYMCSKCGTGNWDINGTETECPFCGADMREYTSETPTDSERREYMTLDEAIKHAEEVAEEQKELYGLCPASESEIFHCDGTKDCKTLENGKNKGCLKCAEEHRQLAEWLKELKQLREQTRWIPCSERLPKLCEEVIVTDVETRDSYESQYIGDGYWKCDNGSFKNRIIAW